MSWINAYLRGFAIFAYFVIATVVVPDVVLDAVGTASSVVQDILVLAVWGAGLVAGMYFLRRFQRRGLI